MFRVVLPIFSRTEEMENAPDDIEFKFTDYDIKDVIFYDITALGTYEEDGIFYTTIHTPGNNFYSPKPRTEVDRIIMNAKSQFILQ